MKELVILVIPALLVVGVLNALEYTMMDKTKKLFDNYLNKNSTKVETVFIDPRKS